MFAQIHKQKRRFKPGAPKTFRHCTARSRVAICCCRADVSMKWAIYKLQYTTFCGPPDLHSYVESFELESRVFSGGLHVDGNPLREIFFETV